MKHKNSQLRAAVVAFVTHRDKIFDEWVKNGMTQMVRWKNKRTRLL